MATSSNELVELLVQPVVMPSVRTSVTVTGLSDSGNALMSSSTWTLKAVVEPVLLKVTR
jgi:hypothetical protein